MLGLLPILPVQVDNQFSPSFLFTGVDILDIVFPRSRRGLPLLLRRWRFRIGRVNSVFALSFGACWLVATRTAALLRFGFLGLVQNRLSPSYTRKIFLKNFCCLSIMTKKIKSEKGTLVDGIGTHT